MCFEPWSCVSVPGPVVPVGVYGSMMCEGFPGRALSLSGPPGSGVMVQPDCPGALEGASLGGSSEECPN